MPAQNRRRRLWSVGIAVLAVAFCTALVVAHPTSARSTSAGTAVTNAQIALHPAARAADLHITAHPPVAGPHLDVSTPPEGTTTFAAPAAVADVAPVVAAADSATTSEHSGRAPPTA